jgi:hypothetical protein
VRFLSGLGCAGDDGKSILVSAVTKSDLVALMGNKINLIETNDTPLVHVNGEFAD